MSRKRSSAAAGWIEFVAMIAEPDEVAPDRLGLPAPEFRLLLRQNPGGAAVAGHEHRGGRAKVDANGVEGALNLPVVARREVGPALEKLADEADDVPLDDIARAFEVHAKRQHRLDTTMLVVGQALRVEAGQVALDLAVERVEHIVGSARASNGFAVTEAQRVRRALDHRIKDVDHPQRFSGCMTERNRRRLQRGVVEIQRSRRIGGRDAHGHQAFENARQRTEKRQERQRENQVECGVKVRDSAGKARLDLNDTDADRREQRQENRGADEARDDISNDGPSCGRISPSRALEQRIERRADVRPDDQGERGVERNDALFREGHHQQRHRDARMGRPGKQRAEGDRDQTVGRDRAHENPQARDILVRRDDLEKLGQRDEHQPEPDGDAADVAGPGASCPEHRNPASRSSGDSLDTSNDRA